MARLELDKWSVKDLYELFRKGRLNPQPKWQRSKVWSEKMKQALIDTVHETLPLGLVMLSVDSRVDEDSIPIDRYDVVDGQQRLTTLFDYRDGASWSTSKRGREIKPYNALSSAGQQRFDEYKVPVALMRDFEEDELLDSYSRLQNAKPLKIGERVKALPTKFHPFIAELTEHKMFNIGGGVHKFRDGHWNLAAIFFKSTYRQAPLERQEFAELEAFLRTTKVDGAKARKACDQARKILNSESKVFEECLRQSAAFEAAIRTARPLKWLFAVFTFLFEKYSLTGREHLVARGVLDYYATKDKENSVEWTAYVNTGRTGRIDTNDVKVCLEQLMNYIVLASKADPLDRRRYFTQVQRDQIYEKSGGKCARCGLELSPTNFHADHIKPFREGGKTEVSNGQALCSKCNREKGGTPDLFVLSTAAELTAG